MISLKATGSFKKTSSYLNNIQKMDIMSILNSYGRKGVAALASATPVRSGLTADSWYYEVEKQGSNYYIRWCNNNTKSGVPVAILLQYGHGTGTGGYVSGRDYINPAIRPIFDNISEGIRKAVKSA